MRDSKQAEANLEVGAVQALCQLLEQRHQHLGKLLRLHMHADNPQHLPPGAISACHVPHVAQPEIVDSDEEA